MRFRKIHPGTLVHDARLQQLRQLDQQFDALGCARRAIGHDHRILRTGQQLRRLLHRAGITLRRRGGDIARDVELGPVIFRRFLLQSCVK